MSIHRVGVWRGRGGHRNCYLYRSGKDEPRVQDKGGILKDGDLCMRVEDTGDYHHRYLVLRPDDHDIWAKAGSIYGYPFGKRMLEVSERVFHLLCAGETVHVSELLSLDSGLFPPDNYRIPPTGDTHLCHDWRNHVPDFIKDTWESFHPLQQASLSAWAEKLAEAEEWD